MLGKLSSQTVESSDVLILMNNFSLTILNNYPAKNTFFVECSKLSLIVIEI